MKESDTFMKSFMDKIKCGVTIKNNFVVKKIGFTLKHKMTWL